MIKDVVGAKAYNVWLDMLRHLVPGGRTHRLSVMVAGMLQYASEIAYEKADKNPKAKKLRELFENVYEYCDDSDIRPAVDIAEELFRNAGVNHSRTSSRGDSYSIAEDAVREFLAWENMPWE